MNINPFKNHRILVIDDNPDIHKDFRKILKTTAPDELDEDEAALFGQTTVKFQSPIFDIDSAYQGREAMDLVEKSLWQDHPYSMAFIDVRMPPGWDGIETISKIWERYPDMQFVICTAYSDYSWEKMSSILGFSHRLVVLKKPFDSIEVLQLAIAMTEKWRLCQQVKLRLDDLERMVQERNRALKAADIEFVEADLNPRPDFGRPRQVSPL